MDNAHNIGCTVRDMGCNTGTHYILIIRFGDINSVCNVGDMWHSIIIIGVDTVVHIVVL